MRYGAIPLIGLMLIPLLPVAALAQPEPPPERIINLLVYGDDPCPQSQGDEIVVCARRPEAERYRIPKKLREKPAPSGGPGWGWNRSSGPPCPTAVRSTAATALPDALPGCWSNGLPSAA